MMRSHMPRGRPWIWCAAALLMWPIGALASQPVVLSLGEGIATGGLAPVTGAGLTSRIGFRYLNVVPFISLDYASVKQGDDYGSSKIGVMTVGAGARYYLEPLPAAAVTPYLAGELYTVIPIASYKDSEGNSSDDAETGHSFGLLGGGGLEYTVTPAFGISGEAGLTWWHSSADEMTSSASQLYGAFFLTYSFGDARAPDADHDAKADPFDRCPNAAQTRDGYKHRDGCPNASADARVSIIDEDRNVVSDATVAINGVQGASDSSGLATLRALVPGEAASGVVTHLLYADTGFGIQNPTAAPNDVSVIVPFRRAPVTVTARDAQGQPVAARVRFEGPVGMEPQVLGADGIGVFPLRPGNWRVLVSSEGSSTERQDFVIAPGQTSPVAVGIAFKAATAVFDAEKREVVIRVQVYFDAGKTTIKEESLAIIDQVANLMLDNPAILQVEVQGHTDADGEAAANLELSQARTEAVCLQLINRGVGAGRLVPRGYGETLPIASNSSPDGRVLNRRVQFMVVSMGPQAPANQP